MHGTIDHGTQHSTRTCSSRQTSTSNATTHVKIPPRMGNCCACLESAGAVDGSSVEMKKQRGGGGGSGGKMAPSLTLSRRMSAPSVAIDGEMVVSTSGSISLSFF